MSGRASDHPSECAVCGADIPRHARACPACGADERTGWREQSIYDGLNLPEEAWSDDQDETAHRRPGGGLAWYWVVAGLLVLLAFGFAVLGLR